MRTELLMSLYKEWGVTHYTFDVIVLTSSEFINTSNNMQIILF